MLRLYHGDSYIYRASMLVRLSKKVSESRNDMSVVNKGWCLHTSTMVTK